MSKQPRTVRTPGAPAASNAAPEGDAATSAAAPAGDTEQLPETPKAAPAVKAKAASAPAPVSTSELPNAIDIDAREIKGPVLTKQGWVCPDETGRRPADALKP